MHSPIYVGKIIKILTEIGPMTRAELGDQMKLDGSKIFGSLLGRMSRATPNRPQRIHIERWVVDHPGKVRYPRPVYAIGPGVNKPKPKPLSNYEKTQRHYHKTVNMVASVWELGIFKRERMGMATARTAQRAALDAVSTVRRVVG